MLRYTGVLVAAGRYQRGGFLLLVIIGMLAVLLAMCVAFLSHTRAEVNAVQTLREKNDCANLFYSALDWTVSVISSDILDNQRYDPANIKNVVSSVRNTSDPCYRAWYRPYEPLAAGWINNGARQPNVAPVTWRAVAAQEAQWVWFNREFFPEGGVRGRMAVQVWDPNAILCVNDWNDDCNPTQCQMTHMLMDYYGDQWMERYRAYRDGGDPKWFNPGLTNAFNNTLWWWPMRYQDMWRIATRTPRYMHWYTWSTYNNLAGMVSNNWATSNTSWLGGFGIETFCLKSSIMADGIPLAPSVPPQNLGLVPGSEKYYPPTVREGYVRGPMNWNPGRPNGAYHYGNKQSVGMQPMGPQFSRFAGTNPETGRSPVNVNTVPHSGEVLQSNTFGGYPAFSMEAVFNVESLRRIIKVEEFFATGKLIGPDNIWNTADDITQTAPVRAVDVYNAMPVVLPDLIEVNRLDLGAPFRLNKLPALRKIEYLRTKLAYQYQETLCRYFTGTYCHALTEGRDASPSDRPFPPFRYEKPLPPPAATPRDGYRPFRTYYDTYRSNDPSVTGIRYKGALTEAEARRVSYAVATYDYSQTRFPFSLQDFRQHVRDDLLIMTQSNINNTTNNVNSAEIPAYSPSYARPARASDGVTDVSFDQNDVCNIVPGKLDGRTANAVFDNIVPGKPGQNVNGVAAHPGWPCPDQITLDADPLLQLYDWRVGRDENTASRYNVYNYHDDNSQLRDAGLASADLLTNQKTLLAKGFDIAAETAPPGPYVRANRPPDLLTGANATPIKEVPYRQLCFGPDWFSTELTTTTTTFHVVINVTLVDPNSNPASPREFFWNQFGAIVELAPNVEAGPVVNQNDPSTWDDRASPFFTLGYYRGLNPRANPTNAQAPWPWKIKTGAAGDLYNMDRYPDATTKMYRTEPMDGIPVDYNTSGEWHDFRGPVDPNAYYFRDNERIRRIVIRAVWNLNQLKGPR